MAAAGAVAGAIAGAAAPLVSDIITNSVNWNIAQENRNLQRETNIQNERLLREVWARDDNARQRMVADLEKAGLSKWLAAGASPMTSSPISLSAPQNNYKADFGHSADALSHAYQNYQQLVQTDQTNKNLKAEGDILAWKKEEAQAQSEIAKHDAEVFKSRPDTASTDPSYLKYFAEVLKGVKGQSNVGQDVKNGLGSLVDKVKEYNSPEAKAERKEKKEIKKDEKFEKVHEYPRRKPLSQLQWAQTNQLKLGSYQTAKLYDEYVKNYYRYAK